MLSFSRSLFILFILFILCLFLVTKNAWSAPAELQVLGVNLPPQITLKETQESLHLNGYAVREAGGEKIYVAAFYTKQTENRPLMLLMNDQAAAMQFYFIKDDISSSILSKLFVEGILLNNTEMRKGKLDKERMVQLEKLLNRTFHAGDILIFSYSPQNGVQMSINQEPSFHWPHAKTFFNMLLRMWIGPFPPSREFKAGILGTKNGN